MPTYTLDANAIIYYTGNDAPTVETLRPLLASEIILYVPTVVITEVFAANLAPDTRTAIELVFATTQIVPLYEHIARLAADIRRLHRVKFPDAAIAATALATRSALITRNVSDFRRVGGLVIKAI